jgi:hypothetical protein
MYILRLTFILPKQLNNKKKRVSGTEAFMIVNLGLKSSPEHFMWDFFICFYSLYVVLFPIPKSIHFSKFEFVSSKLTFKKKSLSKSDNNKDSRLFTSKVLK